MKYVVLAAILLALGALSGCGTPPPRPQPSPAARAPAAASAAPTRPPAATPPAAGTRVEAAPADLASDQDPGEVRARVLEEAARHAGVSPAEVEIVSLEPREWPDTSLGCPEPGQAYAQVIIHGFVARVRAGGALAEYHVDRQRVVECA